MNRWLLALALCLLARAAAADPVRVLLAVGARQGLAGEVGLRHSVRDARRVRDVFVTLGRVRPENAILLEDPSATALRDALTRAAGLARGYPKQDVVFMLYYSGHGDRRRLHVSGEPVEMSELETRLEAIPAGLRIAITDACRTERAKGVGAERAFDVRVGSTAPATGTAWIHAAADGEAAQESDVLGGAVFTHYLVSGLRGAADRDGDRRVTLAEAYAFAFNGTLYRSALASGVLQRPAASLQLAEQAPIVLTETSARSSVIRLPREVDTQYLVYAVGARAVVAEAWSSRDHAAEIALVPGRFFVHRRALGRSSVADIVLASSEPRELRVKDFKSVADEDMLEKGGELVLRPNAFSVTYGARAGTLSGPGHGGRVAYSRRWQRLVLGVGFELGRGLEQRDAGNEVSFRWLGGELRVERAFDVAGVDARIGVRASALHGKQTVARSDAAELDPAGFSLERRYDGWAVGGGLVSRWLIPVGPAFLEIGGTLDLLAARRGSDVSSIYAAGLEVGAGTTF